MSLDRSLFSQKIANFAGKEGVASELHLTGAAPRLLSEISVKFLKLPGKPAPSWEADIPGGYEFKRLRLHGFSLRLQTGFVKLSVVDLG